METTRNNVKVTNKGDFRSFFQVEYNVIGIDIKRIGS